MGFKSSLAAGARGEVLFNEMFPSLVRTDGRREDFYMTNGVLIDLKSESRSTAETANLAIELNSSEDRPGAIERAVNDGVYYIVYLYSDKRFFVYKATDLLNYIYNAQHRTVMVRNSTYRTLVMLVPRDAVVHLEQTALFIKEAS